MENIGARRSTRKRRNISYAGLDEDIGEPAAKRPRKALQRKKTKTDDMDAQSDNEDWVVADANPVSDDEYAPTQKKITRKKLRIKKPVKPKKKKKKKPAKKKEKKVVVKKVQEKKFRKVIKTRRDKDDAKPTYEYYSDSASSWDSNKSENDESSSSESSAESVDDSCKIHKILDKRDGPDDAHEYLVKYDDTSYRHLEWVSHDSILEYSNGRNRLAAYAKIEKNRKQGDDLFPPEYARVERILTKEGEGDKVEYLCKFEEMGYDEVYWEPAKDMQEHFPDVLSTTRVADYERRIQLPPESELKSLAKKQPRRKHLRAWQKDKSPPQFPSDRLKLRDYQTEGYEWLVFSYLNNRNTILADEMGLGKTIQSTSVLAYLNQRVGMRGPFLVISPLSCIDQWRQEILTWTNLKVLVYHGRRDARERLQKYEFEMPHQVENLYKFNVLITTYELVMQDMHFLSKPFWKYVIIDEAHRMKNMRSKLFETLVEDFSVDTYVLLTGTPIQNNIEELWAMLHFLHPEQFPSFADFQRSFGNVETSKQVKRLQKALAPYILRRVKEDVEKSLPKKEETVIEVELTRIQKQYYRAILDRNRDFLNMGSKGPSLMNTLMELRKLCSHPFLIKGAEDKLAQGLNTSSEIDDLLVRSSSKMVLLDKLLPKLKQQNHKVLIFSQMRIVLNILEDFLTSREYAYERLDGSVAREDRKAAIDRFTRGVGPEGGDSFIFLLSTRAGGLGLNLIAADTVIIFDSDWNPQNDLQAQARCHRIGQTKDVKVYRLITRRTYEAKMFAIASKKLGLNQAILGTGTNAPLEADEIEALLKNGAYHLFRQTEEDEEAAEKAMLSEDINNILERGVKVVYDPTKAKVALENHSSINFSKATFVAREEDAQVAFDDPDFWDKVLPEFKNAKMLLGQIKDGSLDTEEAKTKFFKDIEKLLQRAKEASESRSMFSAEGPLHEVSHLLTRVAISSAFTPLEQARARTLQASISSKRKRKRFYKEGNAYNSDKTNASDKDFVLPSSSKKRQKVAPPPSETLWSKKQRENLRKELLKYGYGRWDTLIRQGNILKALSQDQVIAFTQNSISAFFGGSRFVRLKKPKKKEPTNDASSTTDKATPSTKPAAVATTRLNYYGKLCKRLYREARIDLEDAVADAVKSSSNRKRTGTEVAKIKVSVLLVENDKPTREAQSLLPGAKIQIRLQVEAQEEKSCGDGCRFVLVKYKPAGEPDAVPTLLEHYRVSNDEITTILPGFPGIYHIAPYEIIGNDLLQSPTPECKIEVKTHPVLTTNDIVQMAIRASTTWDNRLSVLDELNDIAETYGNRVDKIVRFPTLRLKPPIWWWQGEKHDRALLAGYWKHGFGQMPKLREDASLAFSGMVFEQVVKDAQQKIVSKALADIEKAMKDGFDKEAQRKTLCETYSVDAFPSASALNKRCIRLIQQIKCTAEAVLKGEKKERTLTFTKTGNQPNPSHNAIPKPPSTPNGTSKSTHEPSKKGTMPNGVKNGKPKLLPKKWSANAGKSESSCSEGDSEKLGSATSADMMDISSSSEISFESEASPPESKQKPKKAVKLKKKSLKLKKKKQTKLFE